LKIWQKYNNKINKKTKSTTVTVTSYTRNKQEIRDVLTGTPENAQTRVNTEQSDFYRKIERK
jgi:hypothetical protein